MGKNRTKALDLSDAAVVERAKSMANDWMWAVSLQHDRIIHPRSQDQPFHPFGAQDFHEADVHFLVIALGRLRKTATTLEHAPQQWDSVRHAISAFDARLPWLRYHWKQAHLAAKDLYAAVKGSYDFLAAQAQAKKTGGHIQGG